MCDKLSEKLGTVPKILKITPPETSTHSNNQMTDNIQPGPSNMPTINFDDIVDFVPIPNNAEDFDLSSIINEVTQNDSNVLQMTNEPKSIQDSGVLQEISNVTNNVTNVNQPQNLPVLPHEFHTQHCHHQLQFW